MFAWILNTKPLSFGSADSTMRWRVARGSGPGAWVTNDFNSSSTPKLAIAEPKNTGDCLPARYAARSNAWVAPCTSSISWSNAPAPSPSSARPASLCRPSITTFSPTRPRSPAS